ncbi:protocadherin Fat 3, partial [Biomphalaria glabrata]
DGSNIKDLVTFDVHVINVINEDNLPNITVYNGSVNLNEESPVGTIVPFNYTVSNLVNRTAVYSLGEETLHIFRERERERESIVNNGEIMSLFTAVPAPWGLTY